MSTVERGTESSQHAAGFSERNKHFVQLWNPIDINSNRFWARGNIWDTKKERKLCCEYLNCCVVEKCSQWECLPTSSGKSVQKFMIFLETFNLLYLLLGRSVHVAVEQEPEDGWQAVMSLENLPTGTRSKSSGKANKAVHNCHRKSGNKRLCCAPQEHGSEAKKMEMLVDLRLNGVVGRLPCNLLEMKFSARLLVLVRLPALLPNVRLHCGNGKKVVVVVEKKGIQINHVVPELTRQVLVFKWRSHVVRYHFLMKNLRHRAWHGSSNGKFGWHRKKC